MSATSASFLAATLAVMFLGQPSGTCAGVFIYSVCIHLRVLACVRVAASYMLTCVRELLIPCTKKHGHKATTNCIVGSCPPPACLPAHDSDAVISHAVACRAFVNFPCSLLGFVLLKNAS